jgi:hypothetical protein
MTNTITIALSKGTVKVHRRELTSDEVADLRVRQNDYHAEIQRLQAEDLAAAELQSRREALLDRLLDEQDANNAV